MTSNGGSSPLLSNALGTVLLLLGRYNLEGVPRERRRAYGDKFGVEGLSSSSSFQISSASAMV